MSHALISAFCCVKMTGKPFALFSTSKRLAWPQTDEFVLDTCVDIGEIQSMDIGYAKKLGKKAGPLANAWCLDLVEVEDLTTGGRAAGRLVPQAQSLH